MDQRGAKEFWNNQGAKYKKNDCGFFL